MADFPAAVLLGHLGYAELPWYSNGLIALWLWCFGANVGSFLNVVVYRLPAGMSVVAPRSRCPRCHHLIRWYDNVPVVSWLVLRARCRDCGGPISSRYPLVEAIVAAMFVALAFLEPITMGANLPEPVAAVFDRRSLVAISALRLQTMFTLWCLYAYQLVVWCTLASAALISYDGNRCPRRLFLPALLIGIVAPLWLFQLRPVPFQVLLDAAPWLSAVGDAAAGLAVGAAIGMGIDRAAGRPVSLPPDSLAASCALVGLYLGWQAVAALAPAALAASAVTTVVGRWRRGLLRIPPTAWLAALMPVFLVFWKPFVAAVPWFGPRATVITFALSALIASGLAWLRSAAAPAAETPASEPTTGEAPRDSGVVAVTTHDKPDLQRILDSPSYRLAERDPDFLRRYELRSVRLQLELLKPELGLSDHGVQSTVVAFGGTQIVEEPLARHRVEAARAALALSPEDPFRQRALERAERILAKSRYYDAARKFAQIVSSACQTNGCREFVIVTGGGPGIMEAANRGAHDVGAKSIGLNITLPAEQIPNPYITPELCFQFQYFALRKMHFLLRARALVVFPGGFGTLDELFDALTLRQCQRMQEIPIILFGREYWDRVIDFRRLADEGVIADEHLELIQYAETPEEAWSIIARFHGVHVPLAGVQDSRLL